MGKQTTPQLYHWTNSDHPQGDSFVTRELISVENCEGAEGALMVRGDMTR